MKLNLKSYLILLTVILVSFLFSFLLPISELFKGVAITPGVVALLGVVYQLIRDNAEFEKNKFLQQDQQIFSLGASSYMAKVAFDKHVEFCEKYMDEVNKTMETLFAEGETESVIKHSNDLQKIKTEFATWLPSKISLDLVPFEKALRKMGALEHKLRVGLKDDRHTESRAEAIEESYKIFQDIMNLDNLNSDNPDKLEDLAIENIKEKIRSILLINELTEIRRFIIEKSKKFIGNYEL